MIEKLNGVIDDLCYLYEELERIPGVGYHKLQCIKSIARRINAIKKELGGNHENQ